MKLTANWKLILTVCLLTSWFLLSPGLVLAQANFYNCSNASAPWNRPGTTFARADKDKLVATGTFVCMPDSQADPSIYTRIVTQTGGGQDCSTSYGCAVCPSGQVCAKLADCEARFGSEGYSCQDFNPKDGSSANDPRECIIFHCPNGEYATGGQGSFGYTTCCRTKPTAPIEKDVETPIEEDIDIIVPDEDLIEIEGGTVTEPRSPQPEVKIPTTQSSLSFNLSTCCKSIVRPLSRNAQTGIVDIDQYTLNDIVQSAINVYECILCIVGALMLIMTIIGSTMLIISGGSADKVALGKKIIVGAVVGGIIAFTTYLIIYWTVTALGASFLSPYSAPSDSGDLRVQPGSKTNFQESIIQQKIASQPIANNQPVAKTDNIIFTGCSNSEQAKVREAIKNVKTYQAMSSLNEIDCADAMNLCGSGQTAAYYACRKTASVAHSYAIHLCDADTKSTFFIEHSLVHEYQHLGDCLAGADSNNVCLNESRALTAEANYYAQMAGLVYSKGEEHSLRCLEIKRYKSKAGVICTTNDPKCKIT